MMMMSVFRWSRGLAAATFGGVDFEAMYQAMDSRDRRFDGRFFVAVKTTGIYCRPICPAPTPRRQNTSFYRYAAAAELAGFRPCRRCRPEVSPDTPEWDTRADLVGRGLRLIAEGVADGHGVSGLAGRLRVSERHLQRLFKAEVGATPGVVARSRRARLARQLLTESDLPVTHVAFTAGFGSVRAFNDTIRQIYKVTPSELRRGAGSADGSLHLQLQYRPPLAAEELLRFLAVHAVPGVEQVTESYRRVVPFGRAEAVIELTPTPEAVLLAVDTTEIDSLAPLIQRCRQLMDLDADPHVINQHLGRSAPLRQLVSRRPGLRLVGSYDPFQSAVQAILSRGASPRLAASLAGGLAARFGTPLSRPIDGMHHLFPTTQQLEAGDLEAVGVPMTRANAIRALAAALLDGSLQIDGSMDPADASQALRAIPGIGERTAAMIALRALRDPDAFPVATLLKSQRQNLTPEHVDEWRPWRGYAAMHLWADGRAAQPAAGP